ncbi:MAG: TolC family protein [Candidatus Brocadia sp.]
MSILCVMIALIAGCATYRPIPIDRFSVDIALKAPSMVEVRVQAKMIQHPILKPIDFDDRDGISPDEASILAVLANPKLRAIRNRKKVAMAQLIQAGILPNPQLSYSLGIPTGGNTQGTINAFGLGLGWDITSLIARNARMDAARYRVDSVDIDVAWQEWQVAQAAKLQVYRLLWIGQQLKLARVAVKGLRENLKLVKKSVQFGELTAVDLAAAEAALQQNRILQLKLIQEQKRGQNMLNQALGIPAGSIVSIQQNITLPSWPVLPSVSNITEGLEDRRLDLLALKKGYESQEEGVRAAILSQFPKINIGFTHAGDTTNVVTTGFTVAIDMPFFDRKQGQIAIEQATRNQLFDEYMARLFEARSEINRILVDMDSIKQQIIATEKFIAELKGLVQIYYTALQVGNADILVYYNTKNELIAKQIEHVKLKQELTDLGISLEIATGEYFADFNIPTTATSKKSDSGEVSK